jgi:hypothetical protein
MPRDARLPDAVVRLFVLAEMFVGGTGVFGDSTPDCPA